MSPSSAATVALRLILCPNLCVLCPNVCVVVLVPGVRGSPNPALQPGAHPPLSPCSAGEDPRDSARSSPRVTCQQIGARRPGSIPAPLPESHQDAGFEQGFSSSESGHFRICRKDFWPRPGSLRTVTARPGRWLRRGVRVATPRHGDRPGDPAGYVSLWWPAGGGPGPGHGRLAQRESASFTPRRSLVRSQYRPPGISPGQKL